MPGTNRLHTCVVEVLAGRVGLEHGVLFLDSENFNIRVCQHYQRATGTQICWLAAYYRGC